MSLGDALTKYQEDKAKAAAADTTVHFAQTHFPGSISPEDLQRYASANLKEKASIALGVQSNIATQLFSQKQTGETREQLARTNLYTAQAAAEPAKAKPQPGITSVYDPNTGRYVTIAQGGTVVPDKPQKGIPGTTIYHPDTGKAVGFYDNTGDPHFYPAQGTDISALFGTGAPTGPTTAPTPAAGQAPAAVGPQSTDVAYSTQGDPGNLPPIYRQQPPGAAAAPAQAGQVRVIKPDGTPGYISADQLPAALKAGWQRG